MKIYREKIQKKPLNDLKEDPDHMYAEDVRDYMNRVNAIFEEIEENENIFQPERDEESSEFSDISESSNEDAVRAFEEIRNSVSERENSQNEGNDQRTNQVISNGGDGSQRSHIEESHGELRQPNRQIYGNREENI